MAAVKLTPWFPGNVKPVRVGVYQRPYGSYDYPLYCWWDGKEWSAGARTPFEAKQTRYGSGDQGHMPWRGILKT